MVTEEEKSKISVRFAQLTKVIERCDRAIAKEQQLTEQILREEKAKAAHRRSQARYKAKAGTS